MKYTIYILFTLSLMSTGCAVTEMNRSAHRTYGKEPSTLSAWFAFTADAVTSPIQAIMLLGKADEENPSSKDDKKEQKQPVAVDPAEKTPNG